MHKGVICCCVLLWCWCALAVRGQEVQPTKPAAASEATPVLVVESKEGEAKVIMTKAGQDSPGQVGPERPGSPHPPDGQPPGAPPPGSQPPGAPGAPSTGKPGEPGKDVGPPAAVQRPGKPSAPPNPEEFKVRPDKDGVVQFQFRGQSWPDVLEWFGEISGMSVDWQELPGDYLNVSTQRGYKVEEIRDLLNRLLLVRGYTMLQQDEFMIVTKCDQLNAGLVPQVTAEELDGLPPHDYVRVMFELDWMLADEAVEELEPLLSKNGEIFALSNTNRIEAMDAVANLQEIHRLLTEEQAAKNGEPRMVREFVLKFARAAEMKEQLSQLLGQSSPAQMPMPGTSPEQMAQQQQMMAQMQAQQQQQQQQQMQQMQQMQQGQPGQPGQPTPPGRRSPRARRGSPMMGPKEEPVRMIVSQRRNSIIVQAPPDKMAIIADAVKLLDVQEPGAHSLQAFLGRMQVYRLAQLDPKKLVTSLQDLGGLDPTTRLEVDEANRAIIAYATLADHFTIRSAVEKLDSSARRVEVIQLRRLAADEVAGTIQYLMSGTGGRSSSQSESPDYSFGYSYNRRNRTQPSSEDAFRVDADVANNRLLVRANDVELEEVVSILTKLGEIPRTAASGGLSRVLDVSPGDDAAEFLKRLERDWKSLSPNPLILPELPPSAPSKKVPAPAEIPAAVPAEIPAAVPAEPAAVPTEPVPEVAAVTVPTTLYRMAMFQQLAQEDAVQDPVEMPLPASPVMPPAPAAVLPEDGPAKTAAPIVVSVGPDGRLIISSDDPEALEMFEEFAKRIAPPAKSYQIFHLKSASATWVVLNLEEYFEDEDKSKDRGRDRIMSYIYGYGMSSSSTDEDTRRLSKRRPLKFISDLDTNTILVQGADAEQLKTIAELIKLYDVPEPTNSQKARVTKLFSIKYSKATVVAAVIKDAYRDLLSTNDPALQAGPPGKGQQQQRGGGMTIISPFGGMEEPSPADSRTSARFEGKLSIGIDDVSNTLLVSAEGDNLMSVIAGMIKALDEAAMPVSEIRVVTLRKDTDGSRLREALSKILGNAGGGPTSAAPAPTPQHMPGGHAPPGFAVPGEAAAAPGGR